MRTTHHTVRNQQVADVFHPNPGIEIGASEGVAIDHEVAVDCERIEVQRRFVEVVAGARQGIVLYRIIPATVDVNPRAAIAYGTVGDAERIGGQTVGHINAPAQLGAAGACEVHVVDGGIGQVAEIQHRLKAVGIVAHRRKTRRAIFQGHVAPADRCVADHDVFQVFKTHGRVGVRAAKGVGAHGEAAGQGTCGDAIEVQGRFGLIQAAAGQGVARHGVIAAPGNVDAGAAVAHTVVGQGDILLAIVIVHPDAAAELRAAGAGQIHAVHRHVSDLAEVKHVLVAGAIAANIGQAAGAVFEYDVVADGIADGEAAHVIHAQGTMGIGAAEGVAAHGDAAVERTFHETVEPYCRAAVVDVGAAVQARAGEVVARDGVVAPAADVDA